MKKTIFEKVPFKAVLLVCIFLIAMDVWKLVTFAPDKSMRTDSFLLVSMSLLLIAMGIFVPYRKEERTATTILGLALLSGWLGSLKYLPILLSSLLAMSFEAGALYFYWISYKGIKEKVEIKSKKSIFIVLLLILLLPAIIFWIIGMLSKL
ncbi:MAG: hypothetical protein PHI59_03855 [Candidatus Omnitrophica bacterium]|nr:hypothetical protein [Candidatus Omnitrophota bacterium]